MHFICELLESRFLTMNGRCLLLVVLMGCVSSIACTCDFSSTAIWGRCGSNSTTESECTLQLGCCYAPQQFLNNKNITWRCLQQNKSSKRYNGTCLKYDHGVCMPFFNDTTSGDKRNITLPFRFIDNNIGMERTNSIFSEFFKAYKLVTEDFPKSSFKKTNPKCQRIIQMAMCKYGIPNCLYDETPQQICREDCEYIMKTCQEDMSHLLGAIQYYVIKNNINFTHLIVPKCHILRYSYTCNGVKGNDLCSKVDETVDIKRTCVIAKKEKRIALYVGIAAAVLLVIGVVFGVFRFLRYRKRKQYADAENYNMNMTSIRDRIRANSLNTNPLEELLASAQPGELLQYPLDRVEYIRDLGEGQFGKVFQGRVHGVIKDEVCTDVAVKCLKEGSSIQALEAFNQEVKLMCVLQHENILKLLAVSTEEEPFCMLFEYMHNGDLNAYLRKCKNKETLSDSNLITICKHVAAGMAYLTTKRFIHRDLATRNCLVGENLVVKIADFGMSRNIYDSDYYRVGGEAMLPIRWMPPEAVMYGKFTIQSDIYSYGVTMWEVFSFGMQPFYGYTNEEVIQFIKKGVLLPRPEDCPEWVYEVMSSCWEHEPEERRSFRKTMRILNGQDDYEEIESESEEKASSSYDVVQSQTTLERVQKKQPTNDNIRNSQPDYGNLIRKASNPYYQNMNARKTDLKDGLENPCYVNDIKHQDDSNGTIRTPEERSKSLSKRTPRTIPKIKRPLSTPHSSSQGVSKKEMRYVQRDSIPPAISTAS